MRPERLAPSYLVLDGDREDFTAIARATRRLSELALEVRSADDPEIVALLAEHSLRWRHRPMLIELEPAGARVVSGGALTGALIRLIGPGRAWQVTAIVADHRPTSAAETIGRRSLYQRAAALTAGALGLGLFAPLLRPGEARAKGVQASASRWTQPGRHARQAGVTRWQVKKSSATQYSVKFPYKQRRWSGTLRATLQNQRRTGTTLLTRDQGRFQLAYSGAQLAATSAEGQSMTARFNANRQRWEADSQSERRFEQNKRDVNISLAIAADLSELRRPRRRSTPALGAAVSCGTTLFTGRADALSRSVSCDWATINVNDECDATPPSPCPDCCRLLDDCDCICVGNALLGILGDLACHCARNGYDYGSNGFC